jgi:hypothetical protein
VEDIVKAYPGTTQETAIAGISLYVLGEWRRLRPLRPFSRSKI